MNGYMAGINTTDYKIQVKLPVIITIIETVAIFVLTIPAPWQSPYIHTVDAVV